MYLTILILPLISGILSLNRFNGYKYGPILSTIIIFITAILGTFSFYEVGLNNGGVILKGGYWIEGPFLLEWNLIFDTVTVSMFLPILWISFVVQLYSLGYMNGDPHKSRFFSYLSFFSFAMILLVTAENLLVLFVGWEMVGLVSYLLVNFYFTRIAANHSALKAFLMNRFGDLTLTLCLFITIASIGDLHLSTLFAIAPNINSNLLFLICITLFLAAITKSGQIGLHTWLPAAMEGPTPVSALLHSATMVTAGVYLMIRFSPIIEYSDTILMIIVFIGSLSAFFGACAGLFEHDFKRIIAYSTTSQLGYMFVACGLSQYEIALFHLLNHASFKALLFLSAGAVIHAVSDNQDIRKMGALSILLPFSYSFILLGSLSLMAFPFFTGFYSKDFLLELALIPKNFTTAFGYLLLILAAFLTATYSIRLFIFAFLSKPLFPRSILYSILDPDLFMFLPMFLLGLGALLFGGFTYDLFTGIGHTFYGNSIFTHPNHFALFDGPLSQPSSFKFIPLFTFLGMILLLPTPSSSSNYLSFYIGHWTNTLPLFNILGSKIINFSFSSSQIIYRYFDRGLLEFLGPTGLTLLFNWFAFKFEAFFGSGNISHYSFLILISFLSFLFLLF